MSYEKQRLNKSDKTPVLGVELEVMPRYSLGLVGSKGKRPEKDGVGQVKSRDVDDSIYALNDALARTNKGMDKFYDVGEDGDNIEVRFDPCTLPYWKSQKKAVAGMIRAMKAVSLTPDHEDCGIHIHIEKKEIDEKKLVEFFHENAIFIADFSDRYGDESYSKNVIPTNSDNKSRNDCCIRDNSEYGTFEFRLFKATFDIVKFYANIEFIATLPMFINSSDKNKHKNLDNYFMFVKAHNKLFAHLYYYLVETMYIKEENEDTTELKRNREMYSMQHL